MVGIEDGRRHHTGRRAPPGQASALEANTVSGGGYIGTIGAFVPGLDGQRLTFTAARQLAGACDGSGVGLLGELGGLDAVELATQRWPPG